MKGFVPDEINAGAKIAFIAQNPGEVEEQTGVPLCGRSGKIVEGNIEKYGFTRKDASFLNVLKCRWQHKDKVPEGEATTRAIEHCRGFLQESLYKVLVPLQPNVWVPLGDYGLEALTGFSKIESWRGSVFYHSLFGNRIKVLPTVHPAYLFQMPTLRSASKSDFARIAREAISANKSIEYCDTMDLGTSARALVEMLTTLGEQKRLISLDVETSYNKPFEATLKTVGIAWAKDAGMNVEWELLDTSEQADILARLESYEGEIVTATPFDYTVLVRQGGNFTWGRCHDLTLFHSRFDPETRHTLEYIASMWTDREYWKHLVKKEPLRYNYLDCVAEWEAFTRLRSWCKIRDPKVWEVYERDRQCIPVAVHLHLNGMPFSEEAHVHEQEYYETRRASVEGELRSTLEGMRGPTTEPPGPCAIHPRYSGRTPLKLRSGEVEPCGHCSQIRSHTEASKPLNIRSRKQMMELFEANAITIPTDRKTKEKKFDKAALAAIMRKVGPATARTVGELLAWKKDDKVLSSYFRRDDDGKAILPCSRDGRIHATYQMHTAMSRWSCSKPNLQQLKRPEEDDNE